MTIPASTTGPSLPPTIDRQSAAGVYSGVTHAAVRRPSTTKVATLTYDDSSLAGKSAAFTISLGFASRPIGRCTRRRA